MLLLDDRSVLLKQNARLFLYDTASLRLLAQVQTAYRWPLWQWSPDGHALVLYSSTHEGDASLRRIARTGETVTGFQGAGDWLAITPDGKTLLTEPPQQARPDRAAIDSILLWDIATGQRRGTIPVTAFHPRAAENLAVLPDSRTLLLIHGNPRPGGLLSIWDMKADEQLGEVRLDGAELLPLPDLNAVAVSRHLPGSVAVYRARPFAKLWERSVARRQGGPDCPQSQVSGRVHRGGQ